MSLSNEQRRVVSNMAGAALFTILFLRIGYGLMPVPDLPGPFERITFVLKWEVVTALMLMIGIGTVARKRFFGPGIDGKPTPDLEIDRIYVQNTLEQAFLAVLAHLGLLAHLSPEQLRIIPVLVLLWALGRILFWVGFKMSPTGRAFGFALTFYPTVTAILFSLAQLKP